MTPSIWLLYPISPMVALFFNANSNSNWSQNQCILIIASCFMTKWDVGMMSESHCIKYMDDVIQMEQCKQDDIRRFKKPAMNMSSCRGRFNTLKAICPAELHAFPLLRHRVSLVWKTEESENVKAVNCYQIDNVLVASVTRAGPRNCLCNPFWLENPMQLFKKCDVKGKLCCNVHPAVL